MDEVETGVDMTAVRKTTPHVSRMTAREFLAWPDDPSGQLWQLIDGEPVAMAPPSQTHGAIQAEIGALLRNHLRAHRRDCRLIITPGVKPPVRANWNIRIPDLVVTCDPDDARERLVARPVLAVEILSPSNEADTWANVWAYATIPSVHEILVVQSLQVGAELLRRASSGEWPDDPEAFTDPRATVTLASIGAQFALGEFYDTTSLAQAPG